MGQPNLFYIYFRLFKPTLQILQQKVCEKFQPVYGARIQTRSLWNVSLLP